MKLKKLYKTGPLWILVLIITNLYSQTYNFLGYYNPSVIGAKNISIVYNSNTISGQYLTILGKDNSQITKPYIFVEGFDPMNNQNFQD